MGDVVAAVEEDVSEVVEEALAAVAQWRDPLPQPVALRRWEVDRWRLVRALVPPSDQRLERHGPELVREALRPAAGRMPANLTISWISQARAPAL